MFSSFFHRWSLFYMRTVTILTKDKNSFKPIQRPIRKWISKASISHLISFVQENLSLNIALSFSLYSNDSLKLESKLYLKRSIKCQMLQNKSLQTTAIDYVALVETMQQRVEIDVKFVTDRWTCEKSMWTWCSILFALEREFTAFVSCPLYVILWEGVIYDLFLSSHLEGKRKKVSFSSRSGMVHGFCHGQFLLSTELFSHGLISK